MSGRERIVLSPWPRQSREVRDDDFDDVWIRHNWGRPREFLRAVGAQRRLGGAAAALDLTVRGVDGLDRRDLLRTLKRRSVRQFDRAPVASGVWQALEGLLRRASLDLPQLRVVLLAQAIQDISRGVHAVPVGSWDWASRTALPTGKSLAAATCGQPWVHGTGGVLFFCIDYSHRRYDEAEQDGLRYVQDLRAIGRVAQAVIVRATALGLGTCVTPAFDEVAVARLLGVPGGWEPLYLLKFGNPHDPFK
jgi:nitroreductase